MDRKKSIYGPVIGPHEMKAIGFLLGGSLTSPGLQSGHQLHVLEKEFRQPDF
jgi:hypothetical protein